MISKNTRVHIIKIEHGRRWYLHKTDTARNSRNEIRLFPHWDGDPAWSTPQTYEMANLVRERLKREQGLKTYLAFQAGDTAELFEQ
jgi:Mor family transcriptional regulator